MVNKNLAYVSAEDLDKMDILTTDLDQAPDQLKLEVNIHADKHRPRHLFVHMSMLLFNTNRANQQIVPTRFCSDYA